MAKRSHEPNQIYLQKYQVVRTDNSNSINAAFTLFPSQDQLKRLEQSRSYLTSLSSTCIAGGRS